MVKCLARAKSSALKTKHKKNNIKTHTLRNNTAAMVALAYLYLYCVNTNDIHILNVAKCMFLSYFSLHISGDITEPLRAETTIVKYIPIIHVAVN